MVEGGYIRTVDEATNISFNDFNTLYRKVLLNSILGHVCIPSIKQTWREKYE